MSRLGKTPIKKGKNVQLNIEEHSVEVKGPKGALTQMLMKGIVIVDQEDQVEVRLEENTRLHKKFHGLYRALLQNMILGVSQGFEKCLEMIGVGFRAEMQGTTLKLLVGYSNPILVKIPKGISVSVKGTTITLQGIDKQQLGQFASKIRAFRKPEPYKGKGIRYKGEYVRRKAGKSGKAK